MEVVLWDSDISDLESQTGNSKGMKATDYHYRHIYNRQTVITVHIFTWHIVTLPVFLDSTVNIKPHFINI
jgi:hypothetical protein